ncbi:MAG: hypothetical protein KA314_05400 [Chloroflexi bacterium]|nr:hypothetical protein [Chloroflexota bacterium]MBP8055254.1 hypothetical protein [Chloroflexota bacterium]
MNKQAVRLVASCPECQAQISFRKPPELGDLVTCPECSTMAEVIRESPIKLSWAFDEPAGSGSSAHEEYDFDRSERVRDYDDDDDF